MVTNEQESDVAVSPSPDRKIWMQSKAINMPHDTSKLRGMAVRKMNAPEFGFKAQTPVYDQIGGRKFENVGGKTRQYSSGIRV